MRRWRPARACSGLDPLGAVDEVAGTRLHSEPVERGPAQRGLGPLAKIGGNGDFVGLERALQGGLELALARRGLEFSARNPNPGAATRSSGADIWSDFTVGGEREPDQLLSRRSPPREDAGALRDVRL